MINLDFKNIESSSWDFKLILTVLMLIPFWYVLIFGMFNDFFNDNHYSIIILISFCASVFYSIIILIIMFNNSLKRRKKFKKFKIKKPILIKMYMLNLAYIGMHASLFGIFENILRLFYPSRYAELTLFDFFAFSIVFVLIIFLFLLIRLHISHRKRFKVNNDGG